MGNSCSNSVPNSQTCLGSLALHLGGYENLCTSLSIFLMSHFVHLCYTAFLQGVGHHRNLSSVALSKNADSSKIVQMAPIPPPPKPSRLSGSQIGFPQCLSAQSPATIYLGRQGTSRLIFAQLLWSVKQKNNQRATSKGWASSQQPSPKCCHF